MNRPVITCGTPRSGTSMIAGILHYLGVDLGQYYIRPDSQNPTGYFEDAQILEIDFKYFEKDREVWYTKTKEYLEKKKGLWGWKSPMLSVTIRDVQEIFKELKIKPRYILTQRNLEDIKKSRKKHYGILESKRITEHLTTLDKALKDEEVLIINYNDTLQAPHKVVKNIVDYLHLEPTKDQATRAILSIIQKPSIRTIAVPSRLFK